jgi:hypothetical protein
MKSTVRRPRWLRVNWADVITSLISFMPDVTALNADQSGQRRLADARWPPQDQRMQGAGFQRLAQRFAGADEVLLADILIERARAHAIGQRRPRQLDVRLFVEEAHCGNRAADEDPRWRRAS